MNRKLSSIKTASHNSIFYKHCALRRNHSMRRYESDIYIPYTKLLTWTFLVIKMTVQFPQEPVIGFLAQIKARISTSDFQSRSAFHPRMISTAQTSLLNPNLLLHQTKLSIINTHTAIDLLQNISRSSSIIVYI